MEVTVSIDKKAEKKAKKKKILVLMRVEPETFRMSGEDHNHYTTVTCLLKWSKVIFMFFPYACH